MRQCTIHQRPAAVLLVALSCTLPCELMAQEIRGQVLTQGTRTPVAAATVELLDGNLQAVARARGAADGAFSFGRLRPGRYMLQANSQGAQTAVVTVDVHQDETTRVVLEMPSSIVLLALTCRAPAAAYSTTVLVGTAHDRDTGVALPGVPVQLMWEDAMARSVTDAGGNFRFCEAPVALPITLSTTIWGRSASLALTLTEAAVSRADLPVDMDALKLTIELIGSRPLPGAKASTVTLTLRDARSGAPLQAAAAGLDKASVLTPTNVAGQVRFDRVAPGGHEVRLEQLGYGKRSVALDVPAGQELHFEVRVPPQPIALAPISVRPQPMSERRAPRDAATRVDVVSGAEMARAEQRAASVADLVRQRFPGLFVSDGAFSTSDNPYLENIVCIESVRRLGRLRPPDGARTPYCEMLTVIVDGLPAFQGGALLRNLSVRELESLEYLNPLEAAIRFGGQAAENGALLLWTRGYGPYRSGSRQPTR